MKNYSIRIYLYLAILSLSLCNCLGGYAQTDSAALAAADTSYFAVNAVDGWQLYNSYIAVAGADSVDLDVILRHVNNIELDTEKYIGKIRIAKSFPATDQLISFNLTNTKYQIRINVEGGCFIKWLSGSIYLEGNT